MGECKGEFKGECCEGPRPECPKSGCCQPCCPPYNPCNPCNDGNSSFGLIILLIILYFVFCSGNDKGGGLFGGLF